MSNVEIYLDQSQAVINWPYKSFRFHELMSPDTREVHFLTGTLPRLQALRLEVDMPMPINSGCRSLKHNIAVKGAVKSFHLYEGVDGRLPGSCAVDVGTGHMTGGLAFYEWASEVIATLQPFQRYSHILNALSEHALGTTSKMQDVHRMVLIAMRHGWTIGVARTFIHLDRRSDYPEHGYSGPILYKYS